MKKHFTRRIFALLIVTALLTPLALAETDIPVEEPISVEEPVSVEEPISAEDEAEETPVFVEAEEATVDEMELSLDDDAQLSSEIDLNDEEENALPFGTDDPEPFYWTSEPLANSDALFEGYVESLFGLKRASLFEQRNVGGDLTGLKRSLYDVLSDGVVKIAAGERASTTITLSNARGLSYNDVVDVLNCVTADHPYDMYWYANGIMMETLGDDLSISFNVSSSYAKGQYEIDKDTVATASAAAANARAIVNKYAALPDYDKLVAYRNEICDAVSYNYDAASDSWPKVQHDPWEVIWVFDGNPHTNVVCEGYAKAFQYLCDMSSFSGSVICYSVTGYADGGAHEWNIVRMSNGKNYLADITFCDDDEGSYDWMFLKAPLSGNVSNGYYFKVANSMSFMTCTYQYDDYTLRIFQTSDLALYSQDYLSDTSGTSGEVMDIPGQTPVSVGQDEDIFATVVSVATDLGLVTDVTQVTETTATASVVNIPAWYTRTRAVVTAVPGTLFQLDLGGATGKRFKSSKKKVATVTNTGLVTVKKAGKTKITFKVGKKKRTVTLTVKDPTVPTSIALSLSGTVAARVGEPQTLTYTLPSGTTSGVKWTSSNKKVATVSNGVVTFKKKGSVTITATTTRGKKKAKVRFKVSK